MSTPNNAPGADTLIADLINGDDRARARARQLLPLRGVEAAEGLIPLVTHDDPVVAKWSQMILRDLANEAGAPGQEAEAHAMTDALLTLVDADRSEAEKQAGLRLLAWCFPLDRDAAPIAALLGDPQLRDPARQALERIGTESAADALQGALEDADPAFAEAIQGSLDEIRRRTSGAS